MTESDPTGEIKVTPQEIKDRARAELAALYVPYQRAGEALLAAVQQELGKGNANELPIKTREPIGRQQTISL